MRRTGQWHSKWKWRETPRMDAQDWSGSCNVLCIPTLHSELEDCITGHRQTPERWSAICDGKEGPIIMFYYLR